MALDTYANLKTEIADWLDRDDLSGNIDTFIDLAEARHRNDVRIRGLLKRSQASVNARYTALPSGFVHMKTFRLLTDPVTVLKPINLHEMNRRRLESSGKPAWFTVHEEIELDRTPGETYTGEMIYYAKVTPLSDANPTNVILEDVPGAYLYGALIAAEKYLVGDERVAGWKEEYGEAVGGANDTDRKGRHPGPVSSRPVGATP